MIATLLVNADKSIQSGEEELIAVWQKNTDALRTRHPPKIEFFDHYILILYCGIVSINDRLDFTHQQICIFVHCCPVKG